MGGCVLFGRRRDCLLLSCLNDLVALAADGPARSFPVEEKVCIGILYDDQQELNMSDHRGLETHTTEASALDKLTYESSKWYHLSVMWLYV